MQTIYQRVSTVGIAVLLAFSASACATTRTFPAVARVYDERGRAKFVVDRDFAGAIEDFSRAIELNPNDADAYLGRAIAYNAIGDKRAADRDFKKAVELKPRLASAVSVFRK